MWTGTKADLVSNLENEVAPEEVEDEESGEEEVEDVVGREHGQHLSSLNAGGSGASSQTSQEGARLVRDAITLQFGHCNIFLTFKIWRKIKNDLAEGKTRLHI